MNDFEDNRVESRVAGAELDLPPEFCQYRDEGCELSSTCLDCPFEWCIHDQPGGKQSLMKTLRDGEIARMFHSERKGIKELALLFGVSIRTIQRAVKGSVLQLTSGSPVDPEHGKETR